MPMGFTAAPPLEPLAQQNGPHGQPYFVNGKWTFTKDGKPRKPGALRHLGPLPDDWDVWPPEMEEYFDKLQSEPWDDSEYRTP